jgi:amino acid adenylation domain-containing protein
MNQLNALDLFHRSVDAFGDETAIVTAKRRLSYQQVERDANRLANFLLSSGTRKGSVIAIFVSDVVEAIGAILAAMKTGGIFVPLDISLPDKRLEAMLDEINPDWLITESGLIHRIDRILGAGDGKSRILCLDADALELPSKRFAVAGFGDYQDVSRPQNSYDPDDMCYIYFTSGSTGKPKGIAGRVKGIDHFIRWEIERLGVGKGTRVSQILPLSFDGSLRDIFVPLCAGGVACMPGGRETLLDATKLVQWVDRERIGIIHCVPSLFRSMLNEINGTVEFRDLKYVLLAGEPLLPSDVCRWHELFGERIQLINLYGTSETTMAKFIYFVTPADKDRPSIPIGKPMPGARALILDEKGVPCPTGVIGEIYIRTPYRSLGYYKQPEATQEVFVQNPFSDDPSDIVYKTGDLGRILEDGNYEFLGRKDQQVKVRGIRIELAEIENRLRKHESVADVAVTDHEDEGGDRSLCAYIVPRQEIDVLVLRDYLSAYLPDYMIPSGAVFLDQLPKTISGKVDRRALPPPRFARIRSREGYVAPKTPVQEVLAGIWSRLLGVPMVGLNDNFFQLGGHSLLVTQVISRIRHIFKLELPLQVFFEAPVLGQLAQKIDEALRMGDGLKYAQIEKRSHHCDLPASFAQQRLWLIDQLSPHTPAYNIVNSTRLRGALNRSSLEQAIGEVVRRHEVLRTVLIANDGAPKQIINQPESVKLPVVALMNLAVGEREKVARQLAAQEALRRFDLARGPLISLVLLQLDEEDYILLLTMHHITGDAWSSSVLLREIARLYQDFNAGLSSSLPDLHIQYADFAIWQREWLRDGVLKAQLDYWKRQLSGNLPAVELPADFARPALLSYRGAVETFKFEKSLIDKARKLSYTEGATLFMTLLAGFAALLHRYTGQKDIIVGTDVANRNFSEIEALVGFFVNQLVMRTDLSGDPTFRELLRRARDTSLGAYAHQDLPFEKLVEELRPERDLARTPFFNVKILLQNVPQEAHSLSHLTLSPFKTEVAVAPFDLVLAMIENPDGLVCEAIYSTDLFRSSTVRELLQQFQRLLRAVTENPEQRVSDISVLDEMTTGGFSAADFPESGLSQMEFEKLILEIKREPDPAGV